jgi:general secretion pathway protein E
MVVKNLIDKGLQLGRRLYSLSRQKPTSRKQMSKPAVPASTQSQQETIRQNSEDLALQGILSGDDVNQSIAIQFGIPVIDELSLSMINRDICRKVPYAFVKKHVLIPFKEEAGIIFAAIADPLNIDSLEELQLILECPVKAVYCSKNSIIQAIHECYSTEEGAASKMLANLTDGNDDKGDGDFEVFDLLDDKHEQAPIIKLLNLIITEAIQQGASDIHFEPSENTLRVRYRIDGVLQNRHSPAQEYQAQLLTRLKVMAKMDIAEHRLPQDGRIKLRMGGREIDFRVSTVPVTSGERIVLRILDKGNVILGLDKIGMLPETAKEFKRLTNLSEGIILVTGPTGSGKTTSLYSAICEMSNDEVNIMTIEDPVEYNLKGIAQIGVHPKIKLDFAAGLRHILRQDPDVIMIGEIRDRETAEIAIQASLTGHLVLSTLHTNDAPSTVTRLVDMGIEPYLLSSCLVGILAQRLLRKICPGCKERYYPTEVELQRLGIDISTLIDGHLYHGKGCSQCFGSGYKGRHGVYELMTVNQEIQKQIVTSPDAVTLRNIATQQGLVSLRTHGAELVRQGITTVAEVLRVTRELENG